MRITVSLARCSFSRVRDPPPHARRSRLASDKNRAAPGCAAVARRRLRPAACDAPSRLFAAASLSLEGSRAIDEIKPLATRERPICDGKREGTFPRATRHVPSISAEGAPDRAPTERKATDARARSCVCVRALRLCVWCSQGTTPIPGPPTPARTLISVEFQYF